MFHLRVVLIMDKFFAYFKRTDAKARRERSASHVRWDLHEKKNYAVFGRSIKLSRGRKMVCVQELIFFLAPPSRERLALRPRLVFASFSPLHVRLKITPVLPNCILVC